MTTYKTKRYGWRRDHLDARDHVLTVAKRVPLPAACDLRKSGLLPPVYDQQDLGSCTANAVAAAVDFERRKQSEQFLTPSRLFIYYNERVIEGYPDQDAGAELRDGIKTVAAQGVCPESAWPYDESQFATMPPDACYTDAVKFKALQYSRVTQTSYFPRHCLAILGRPVVFGINAYDALESDQVAATGIVPMPGPDDTPIGGHAICLAGYDDSKQLFTFRNSWGDSWGDAGYGYLPYAYVLDPNLASDFWVILAES
ncbi:MAG TPA: C1 family peptidase [Bryobacteraceae bacterium]|nr:C1 family peptidase [Bryobacteraceae bacterium]